MSQPIDVHLDAPEPAAALVDERLRRYGSPAQTSGEVMDQVAGRCLDDVVGGEPDEEERGDMMTGDRFE